jgi:hypothetical protein
MPGAYNVIIDDKIAIPTRQHHIPLCFGAMTGNADIKQNPLVLSNVIFV